MSRSKATVRSHYFNSATTYSPVQVRRKTYLACVLLRRCERFVAASQHHKSLAIAQEISRDLSYRRAALPAKR